MKVNYMNCEQRADCARVTFVGFDPATGKRRRPVIELDARDLAQLVEIAKAFRNFQKRIAAKHDARGDTITQAGVA